MHRIEIKWRYLLSLTLQFYKDLLLDHESTVDGLTLTSSYSLWFVYKVSFHSLFWFVFITILFLLKYFHPLLPSYGKRITVILDLTFCKNDNILEGITLKYLNLFDSKRFEKDKFYNKISVNRNTETFNYITG